MCASALFVTRIRRAHLAVTAGKLLKHLFGRKGKAVIGVPGQDGYGHPFLQRCSVDHDFAADNLSGRYLHEGKHTPMCAGLAIGSCAAAGVHFMECRPNMFPSVSKTSEM